MCPESIWLEFSLREEREGSAHSCRPPKSKILNSESTQMWAGGCEVITWHFHHRKSFLRPFVATKRGRLGRGLFSLLWINLIQLHYQNTGPSCLEERERSRLSGAGRPSPCYLDSKARPHLVLLNWSREVFKSQQKHTWEAVFVSKELCIQLFTLFIWSPKYYPHEVNMLR